MKNLIMVNAPHGKIVPAIYAGSNAEVLTESCEYDYYDAIVEKGKSDVDCETVENIADKISDKMVEYVMKQLRD